jgi:hypothetical protein
MMRAASVIANTLSQCCKVKQQVWIRDDRRSHLLAVCPVDCRQAQPYLQVGDAKADQDTVAREEQSSGVPV